MIKDIIKKEKTKLFILFIVGIISRLLLLEKYQTHWDGPTYAFAITKYSFAHWAPSPPGYPLYVALGRFFHFYFTDPHISMLLVSVLFAGIGVVVFYVVGSILFNKTVGLIVSLLFLSSSTIFYFGITVNPYGILPTTAALLVCLVYLICIKKSSSGIYLGLLYSFVIGIRPQDALFLTPLALYGFFYLAVKEKLKAITAFIISFFLWFIPLANAVGGFNQYFYYLKSFSENGAVVSLAITHGWDGWIILLKGYVQTLGVVGLFPVYYLSKIGHYRKNFKKYLQPQNRTIYIIFIFWIVPALLFNAIVRSDHAAHQMTYLSAFLFLAAYAVYRIGRNKRLLIILVSVIVLYNFFAFFRDRDPGDVKPYVSQSYHYSEILKNNIRTPAITDFVNKYSPKTTIVITDSEIFRQTMYYLPNYQIFSYQALETNESWITYIVHHGYQWEYDKTQNYKKELETSKKDTTVILIPNNKDYTFNGIKPKKIFVAGNAFMYIFKIDKNAKYLLSIHTITKE